MFYKILFALVLVSSTANLAAGQRTRPVGEAPAEAKRTETTQMPAPQQLPPSVKAKYEGGMFGYRSKVNGTLSFDDVNERLIFRTEEGKELISMPYKAVLSVFADTQSKRPTAAGVIGGASIYTLPALLIKKKYRYLTIQYRDPDTRAEGITSFKIDDKSILNSVVTALASKAELTPRGEIFVRQAAKQ
ncbi:MAG: hypothetical protein WKF30_12135 [Pyrinomonadaceae bacterium]